MSRSRPRGFTLVELLVVIGIIAILAALLTPAVYSAVVKARNTSMAMDISQLANAIESYKQDKGDYPPNFRDTGALVRHFRKCYPKMNPQYMAEFLALATDINSNTFIDEGESLVFWLTMVDADPEYPFLMYYQPATPRVPNPKKYYDFDETRLIDANGDGVPSYRPKYAKDTFYVYMDSRSYDAIVTTTPYSYAFAENPLDLALQVRPYWSEFVRDPDPSQVNLRLKLRPMNYSTFQIVCAGQDGEFGEFDASDSNDVKVFPSSQNYRQGDKDNLTNFSEGRTLVDAMP